MKMKQSSLRAFDCVLVICLVVGLWRLWPAPRKPIQPLIGPGTSLRIPNVSWQSQRRHVVYLLDVDCRACEMAAPFVRATAERASARADVDFIVLATEPTETVKAWLAGHGVTATHIKRITDVGKLGVLAYPTLLMVSPDGTVSDVIQGVPTAKEQKQFLDRIDLASSVPVDSRSGARELYADGVAALKKRGPVQMLDIRDRTDAGGSHDGILNIPDDELAQRSMAELSQSMPIVLDCRDTEIGRCRIAGMQLVDTGFDDVAILLPSRRWWQ